MAVYPQTILPDPVFLQTESYSAQDDRRFLKDVIGPGASGRPDHKISFVSGRTVRMAAGVSFIKGRNVADQGYYRETTVVTNDVTLNVGDATNPRIDQIIVRIMDNAADGAGFNEARLEAVPGTPTAGATLDNRSGALNLDGLGESSKNWLLLADVLVPAGASTLLATNIRDRRVYSSLTIPKILDDMMMDMVPMIGPYGYELQVATTQFITFDENQSFSLVRLPRPISQVNHIHWTYRQAEQLVAQYVFAIFDASGRLVAKTASTGTAGGTGSTQRTMVPLTAPVDIDAGMYYVMFGLDTADANGWLDFVSYVLARNPITNLVVTRATGGITVPDQMNSLSLTDQIGAGNFLRTPAIALAVG